ncbi:AIR synthase family protein [Alkaliphilus peptidifermentans]|uniref:Hydrogenase expression/formation protein HypE n=1 Tax=Alkaliphilus peptidifermentans DSM 18978 TaxID=1120976 RepID=A0A1G5L3Q5_9FIRM|nr:AIR synthase family protein [Alkaliphilus peptidifermentans]SCZ06920.1 hydrogenase expression/formation protein HypE [Alkaliphilus peptidifermentans DSM 18978]
MKVGKLPTSVLKEVVFSNITSKREEVLVRPGIGEDCAVIDFGEYVCVLSTDPITGAINNIGHLAIHISCNDVASNGIQPIGIMITILAPTNTTKEDIQQIMRDANNAAASIDVEIIGGHTEITDAVNRVVISTTAIGKQLKNDMISTRGAKVGDVIIMTKHAGLEGASIIATDFCEELKQQMSTTEIDTAINFSKDLSVVKEGIVAGRIGVHSMHDVTEGGILGALWELAEASDLGIEVDINCIPISQETRKISNIMNINPYRLISSGVMLISLEKEKANDLIKLLDLEGVKGTIIGRITKGKRVIVDGGNITPLAEPDTDELYKVFEKKV